MEPKKHFLRALLKYRLFCLFLVFCAFTFPLPAQDKDEKATPEVTPADVFQRVSLLRNEIDLIRLEMGKPPVPPPVIQVDRAAPREVYFMAVALFRKADRLAFEHSRERVDEPALPAGELEPADVLEIVNAALGRIERVKETLKIPEQSETPPLESGNNPTGVFNLIAAANREINELLIQKFSPGDVYEQVTVAIAYASRLLDTPTEISTPPEPPGLIRRKRPADVYRRLTHCFDDIQKIGTRSGFPMLDLKVDDQLVDGAAPSDVYDLASLLVSEFAYLHSLRVGSAPPRSVQSPGRKIPSEVYQRIGILCKQMETLKLKVDNNPDWLKD